MATPPLRRHQGGISMIEVLVGLVIGLIGMVIMLEMLTTWDARKRTTASGNEAQIAGAIALYSLERDLKLAGFNLGYATMGGNVLPYDGNSASANFILAPVVIKQNDDGGPGVKIQVVYGSSDTAMSKLTVSSATATTLTISNKGGILVNDYLLAKNEVGSLQLLKATSAPKDSLSVTVAPTAWTPCTSSCEAFNIGSNPQVNIWQINNSRLIKKNWLNNTDSEITTGVIDLQAQYWIDNDLKDSTPGTWKSYPLTTSEYAKISAVRVAILARSQQFEPPVSNDAAHTRASSDSNQLVHVTETPPFWSGGNFTMTNLDGSAANTYPTDPALGWRNYRYRVFESVIPLRNMIWGTPQ